MDKRYQVFISSTFTDLLDERRAVMQALLELDCIPAGMELFPASSDDQWTLIKRVIDDCDYYLVILAGRYGSVDPQGIGYTEKEYDYAVSVQKPVIAFLHHDPQSIATRYTDQDPELRRRLALFRDKVQTRMCKYWTNADELGAAVSRSYVRLIKTHPAEGWVKSRYAKTADELEKVNQMHEQIRVLEQEITKLRQTARASAASLAQGEDPVKLKYSVHDERASRFFVTTWNAVFAVIGEGAIDFSSETAMKRALEKWIDIQCSADRAVSLSFDSFRAIKVQLYSLGLIETRITPGRDLAWALTEQGRVALADLLAAKRAEAAQG